MKDILVYVEYLRGAVADITYMALAQARVIAESTGGKVLALLVGSNASDLANDLAADEVLYLGHANLKEFAYDPYIKAVADVIKEKKPRLVLFGDTSIGSDLEGVLSVRLNLPLVSFCKEIKAEGGNLKFVCQICGGKIFSEGLLPEETTLVTMLPGSFKVEQGKSSTVPTVTLLPVPEVAAERSVIKEYIEPSGEDIDISKEQILVAIGRGIENEDNVATAEELAKLLGGALCASRPVVDQGWLPTTRLVGKSGKTVKPKVYLALGISGAPEHVEAIDGSELIIAVNTDPNAPIFNLAKYGTTEDLIDVTEELIAAIKEAKGG